MLIMKIMKLKKSYHFDSGHYLSKVENGHPCKNMHGHRFEIVITVQGEVVEGKGWVMDFSEITKAVKPLIDRLDHSLLNDVEGLSNPTSENIAVWFWNHLIEPLPLLHEVEVKESDTSSCIYNG